MHSFQLPTSSTVWSHHRQFTLVAAPNAETIQSNPLNPPPGPSHAALAQRARQARERAEREAAAQAMQAQQPPNIALIPEELLPAPLDPPQIPENQQVPVNIEDNQETINQQPPGNNIEQGVHAHPQPNEQPLPPAQLNEAAQQHDIVLFKHDGGFQRMSSWNPAYACLYYVLLFPKGEHGFQRHIPIQGQQWQPGLHPQAAQRVAQLYVEGHEPDNDEEDNGPAGNQQQRRSVVSEREYYAYYLFSCEDPDAQTHYPGANGTFSTIFQAGCLLQQYLVDVWAIADQSRLLWLCNNQSLLTVELYSGLCDALLSDNLTHREQDAMAISCYLGEPQLFIAMTANPKWPEIHSALLPGQTYSDRSDLITWVFELKCHQLMEDITQKGIFGKCIAHVHTIEFQKRGLPHMHLSVWLECASHILEPGNVDELICAELPIAEGPGADPALYAVVTSSMLHGPCGPEHHAPCWDKDKKACTKGYYPLKQWNAQTIMVADSYPLYWHRDNGQTFRKVISGVEITFDNTHVVPYNPFLSKKYTCHMNVETCSGIGAIKYVLKYVYKGGDRISIELTTNAEGDAQQAQNLDEIKTHLDACWEVPNIVHLQVHLPEQQSVSFCAGQLIENVISAAKDTSLTAFFKLNAYKNQEVCRFANELVYQEIPNKFTWNKITWKFSLQRLTQNNGVVRFSTGAIGQMYFVPPNSGERLYLRTLLTVVHGPTSFESLCTFEGQVFPTFKEVCIAQGLLESDEEWAKCLAEAAQYKTGRHLCHLFVVTLTACHPMDPAQLWIQFCAQICDDIRYKLSQEPWNCPHALDEDVYDFGLYLVEVLVLETGSNMQDVNMPTCQKNWDQINQGQNCLIWEQYALHNAQPEGLEDQLQQQLNNEQLAAFNQVLASVQNDLGVTFFLD
ncbi:Helitron helicase-like domain at N-terminus [Rhizoctonia solani]|uniref:Helitron helicase-like domain at N-terminus n=1 Tax=Rhizoctonia solani TaxID=456999 RepID=A0A8H8NXE4_9AGAM|nr:Helitron helicase-like domain at N-terminus [Rhizoctonia solani]QRW20512.1 Helitron helicase-like domain at N-terminus [Rhizoctonia solani]